jgi:hypothetical protein
MTTSLFTRVAKLEGRRRTDDRVLLLWIKRGDNSERAVRTAKNDGVFSPGEMVMCAEWLGSDPMPKPKWLKRDGASFGLLSEQEDEYITAMLQKLIAKADALIGAGKPAEVAGLARPMPHDLRELSSVELMHCALGVET